MKWNANIFVFCALLLKGASASLFKIGNSCRSIEGRCCETVAIISTMLYSCPVYICGQLTWCMYWKLFYVNCYKLSKSIDNYGFYIFVIHCFLFFLFFHIFFFYFNSNFYFGLLISFIYFFSHTYKFCVC